MEFKVGEQIVFTDEFKKNNRKYFKYQNFVNEIFTIKEFAYGYIRVSINGTNKVDGYPKEYFRYATEKDIIHNTIKSKFII